MGNRLSVVLPIANWTISDGTLEAGQPAIWHANRVGTKTLTAEYADMENSVAISVSKGEISGLILLVNTEDSTWMNHSITADDDMTIKVKAHDSDGNRWTENVAWTIEHFQYTDQSVLQEMTYGSTTMFVPVFASPTPYTLRATYSVDGLDFEVALNITVSHGDLNSINLVSPAAVESIDADDDLNFIPQLFDGDSNPIDPGIVSYTHYDTASEVSTNITEIINGNGGVWYASTVGVYEISVWAISDE